MQMQLVFYDRRKFHFGPVCAMKKIVCKSVFQLFSTSCECDAKKRRKKPEKQGTTNVDSAHMAVAKREMVGSQERERRENKCIL